MRIGIDISQLAYPQTGVSNYLRSLLLSLFKKDNENEYILFYSSMRKKIDVSEFTSFKNVRLITKSLPPTLLDFMWNKLHVAPIEWFVGDVDLFITSDWTEPPTKKTKKATIIYDLIVYKFPQETDKKIIDVQKRKLQWVKREASIVFCISESTKNDVKNILHIEPQKLHVIYPGAS